MESIIQDLMKKTFTQTQKKVRDLKDILNEEFDDFINLVVLEILMGHIPDKKLRKEKLKEIKLGHFNNRFISVPRNLVSSDLLFNSFDEYFHFLKSIYAKISLGWDISTRRITIKSFKSFLKNILVENIEQRFDLSSMAKQKVENEAIVFIDEIDKIASSKRSNFNSKSPSTDGVQRDLLPIVEGTKIKTQHGFVNTMHILFVAAGAFSQSKPQDLLPELLGM